MSTRTFKIGDAEIFQDKPNQEAKTALELSHKKQEEMGLLLRKSVEKISNQLAELSDVDLSNALSVIVRKVKKLKQENKSEE